MSDADYSFDFINNSFDDCIMSFNGTSFWVIKECKKTFKLYKLDSYTKNIDTRYRFKIWTKNRILNNLSYIFLTLDECLSHYDYKTFLKNIMIQNSAEYKKEFLRNNNKYNLIEDTEKDENPAIYLSA